MGGSFREPDSLRCWHDLTLFPLLTAPVCSLLLASSFEDSHWGSRGCAGVGGVDLGGEKSKRRENSRAAATPTSNGEEDAEWAVRVEVRRARRPTGGCAGAGECCPQGQGEGGIWGPR